MRTVLFNGRIFDGTRTYENGSVTIEDGLIHSLNANVQLDDHSRTFDLQGHVLAPGFVDVQVNGGGGVLFNTKPSVEGIQAIAKAHNKFGTTTILPTLISDDWSVMLAAAAAIEQALSIEVPGVRGIHFEGPYLNPIRKGCHRADAIRQIDDEALSLLTSGRLGAVVVTLAPEVVPMEFIRSLSDAGVRVCAGHTAATAQDARVALDNGLCGFTHLFNAMGPLSAREPGVLGVALDDADSWCGVIADGFHVEGSNLRLAVRSKPVGKVMLVTDAMPSVGAEVKSFEMMGEVITAKDGRCIQADGTVAGSDLDMATAVRNMVELSGMNLEEALRMASLYPAQFLGLDCKIGRIAPGYDADLVLLDDHQRVQGTWIKGNRQF